MSYQHTDTPSSCLLDGFDYQGLDLNACGAKTDSASECQFLCQTTEDCVQFVWIGIGSRATECCLKHTVNNNPHIGAGLVSGPKFCGMYHFCFFVICEIMLYCYFGSACGLNYYYITLQ